jgi:glycosyltransferase involved in cell wall biosynthesis
MKSHYSIPFTALIVTLNEGSKLKSCLQSFKDCGDLIVVDLGSKDNSKTIAKQMGARVFEHKWVPVVEMVWPDAVDYAFNSWIIRADPDEVYPENLFEEIQKIIKENHDVGTIRVPHRFYFRHKPLYTTRWGQIKSSPKVFHRDRVILKPLVHSGIVCKQGYKEMMVSAKDKNLVLHYWSDSYKELIKKHWRYIGKEGEAQYGQGKRFTWRNTAFETINSLYTSMIKYNGIRGGMDSIVLSFFHAWYTMMVSISLGIFQNNKRISK